MPRNRKPDDEPIDTIDHAALAEAGEKSLVLAEHLNKVIKQFGDGAPYEKLRLVDETKFFLQHSATAMLEAGKRLILIKEHEPHGEFLNTLEAIGIAERAARKMMQAAYKFCGPNQAKFAALGKSKLLELMVEDDEDLAALAEGGTIADLDIDDVDRMSVSELRQALRKSRDKQARDKEVHDKMIEQKDKKINDLDRKLHKKEPKTRSWPFRVREVQIETTEVAAEVANGLNRIDEMRDVILNEDFGDDREAAIEAMAVVYFDAVTQLSNKVDALMFDCEQVFSYYKEKARPMLEVELPDA